MGVGLDPRPADLTRPALWAAPNLSSVVAAIEGCTPAAQGGMTHASLLAVAGYVRDRFAPLPARFTLSLYLDSPDPTVPSHEAATFDGQTVTVYEDGRLTDRFEVADGDPLPELWSMTTPSGQQGEIYAAFLFDEAFSADRVAALASCHPETTDRLRRCAAGEDCGCVRR